MNNTTKYSESVDKLLSHFNQKNIPWVVNDNILTIDLNCIDNFNIDYGIDNTTKFKVGDKAWKPKGYKFPCTIVSVFTTTKGEIRVVAEMEEYGLLHIFNEQQLEPVEN